MTEEGLFEPNTPLWGKVAVWCSLIFGAIFAGSFLAKYGWYKQYGPTELGYLPSPDDKQEEKPKDYTKFDVVVYYMPTGTLELHDVKYLPKHSSIWPARYGEIPLNDWAFQDASGKIYEISDRNIRHIEIIGKE